MSSKKGKKHVMNHFIFFSRFVLVLFLILSVGGCSDHEDTGGEALVGWAVGGLKTGGSAIINTRNGGQTWVHQGTSQIPDLYYNDVSAVDSQNAWVVGGNGNILNTTDSGITWVRQAWDS